MKRQVEAIFENGVLRPLEDLFLAEREHVTLTVVSGDDAWLDTEFVALAQQESDPTITIDAVRDALSSIPGSLSDVVIAERDGLTCLNPLQT